MGSSENGGLTCYLKSQEFEYFRKTDTQLQLQNPKYVVVRNFNAKLETTEQRIVTVARKVDSILILPESISNIVPDPTLVNNCIKKKVSTPTMM